MTQSTNGGRLASHPEWWGWTAPSLDVPEKTVKWHLKIQFGKLNAGARRHAVDRSRLLGLVS